jgi:ubiquinone/menaquinone biosynthesis C-methylase UbiE
MAEKGGLACTAIDAAGFVERDAPNRPSAAKGVSMAGSFDPVAYKDKMRTEWGAAAAGWHRWYEVAESEEGGRRHSAKLVELAGIGPGDAVLDVAGGYGEPSLAAARAVGPSGRVVCTDLSGEMLAFGQGRAAAAGLANVEFVEADAERLDFAEGSFDAVLSRAGLMFLPDVPGTLRRLRAFLKPGGRLAASVWGRPPAVPMTALIPVIFAELNLPPPPPGRPGMFALADPDRLAALVAGAGFRDVATGTLQVVFATDSPEQFTEFIRDVAPIAALVDGQPPEVQARVWRKVTEAWASFRDAAGRVRTENEAIWVVGTK